MILAARRAAAACLFGVAAIAGSRIAFAAAAAKDRAAVEACLRLAEHSAAHVQAAAPVPEEPAAPGRLAAAAAEAKADPANCIGSVATPCQQAPGGYSTIGMMACNRRELAVWDERLNRLYRAATAGGGKEAEALRRVERAWIALRDARCALPGIQEAGGSIVGPLTTACLLDETARQAIWLENLDAGAAAAR